MIVIAIGALHGCVSLELLHESPVEEEHVHLEPQIDQEADDECGKEALPSRTTDSLWKLECVRVFCWLTPLLSSILAFPNDLVFAAMKFPDHENGSDTTDDDDKRPEEIADSSPDVGPVGKSDCVDARCSTDSHSNASVDEPFWIDEEEILSVHQEEESPCQTVERNNDGPGDGTSAQRKEQQAIVTPHID